MTTIWLNKCFKKPFKLKNSSSLSCWTHAVLPNVALPSRSHRFYEQVLIKKATRESNSGRIICGQYYSILRPEKELNFPALARQFHGSIVRYQEEKKPETLQELVETTERPQTAVTVSQKVAQAGKDVSYFAVILAGFAVTGALLWYVFSELFLSSSPNKIYADALKKVKLNEELVDALGEPIKAYGEETSRGRRRHVSFQEYIVAGENYMRVKFYVSGSRQKGTVHVDVKQVSSRRYEYRFIFVELEGFPPRTIIIEDNRLDID